MYSRNKTQSDGKVCLMRKPSSFELFLKSFKFFSMITFLTLALATILKFVFAMNPLYLLFSIGVFCSLLTSYYKIRMLIDPTFKPDCNCVGDQSFTEEAMSGVLSVLDHKKATLFLIPNSIYGIFFYTFMLIMLFSNMNYSDFIIKNLNIISVTGSCWLWYIMITEVKNICVLCTTIHSINFLSFYYLFF